MAQNNSDREIDTIKFIALDEEVNASINLIKSGLAELQNISMANDFFYLPFLILSSGFEKLSKVYICFYYWEMYGRFPSLRDFEDPNRNKHNLLFLKNKILQECFVVDGPILQDDFDILTTEKTLNKLIEYLGDFGMYSRFYNLDIIISNPKQRSNDTKARWEKLETELLQTDSNLFNRFMNNLKNINRNTIIDNEVVITEVQKKIIILLEIYTRALVRQFTMGNLGGAKRFTGSILPFLTLDDNQLGKRDYRDV